jgi:hypothetical protein
MPRHRPEANGAARDQRAQLVARRVGRILEPVQQRPKYFDRPRSADAAVGGEFECVVQEGT